MLKTTTFVFKFDHFLKRSQDQVFEDMAAATTASTTTTIATATTTMLL